jgi:hypothetical protein
VDVGRNLYSSTASHQSEAEVKLPDQASDCGIKIATANMGIPSSLCLLTPLFIAKEQCQVTDFLFIVFWIRLTLRRRQVQISMEG